MKAVRLVMVLLALLGGGGVLYLVAWVIVSVRTRPGSPPGLARGGGDPSWR